MRYRNGGSKQRSMPRVFLGSAAAAVAAVAAAGPFTEIAQDKTAIAVFSETACVIQHDRELLVIELAARFEFAEVDAVKGRVVRFQDSYTSPFASLDPFQISVAMQQRNRCMKSMIACCGQFPPGIAQNVWLAGPAEFS